MHSGQWITIVAILAVFAVPVTAIIVDFRRRRLQYEERRLMIERGMQPPPMEEQGDAGPSAGGRRDKALYAGVTLTCLGIGLGVAAWLLQDVLDATYIPRQIAGPMGVGAAIVGFLGIGNLVYFAISRPHGTGS